MTTILHPVSATTVVHTIPLTVSHLSFIARILPHGTSGCLLRNIQIGLSLSVKLKYTQVGCLSAFYSVIYGICSHLIHNYSPTQTSCIDKYFEQTSPSVAAAFRGEYRGVDRDRALGTRVPLLSATFYIEATREPSSSSFSLLKISLQMIVEL